MIIAGPTASGKTSLAIDLAARLNAELVGADSMQLYKYMNVGTDTPKEDELGGIAHHLVSFVEPDDSYDVARFMSDADAVIRNITARKKRAIVVGGTGLYIRILLKGLQAAPPPDRQLRKEITKEAKTSSWQTLHNELKIHDPITAARLHPNDSVRILRAVEVLRQSGKPISQWQKEHAFRQRRYPSLFLVTDKPREELYRRINSRVDQMMKQGFLDEVKNLLERGYPSTLKSMQALGYKHLCEHIENDLPIYEAIEKTKTDTRRFAKRQQNWFKNEAEAQKISHNIDEIHHRAAIFFEEQECIN